MWLELYCQQDIGIIIDTYDHCVRLTRFNPGFVSNFSKQTGEPTCCFECIPDQTHQVHATSFMGIPHVAQAWEKLGVLGKSWLPVPDTRHDSHDCLGVCRGTPRKSVAKKTRNQEVEAGSLLSNTPWAEGPANFWYWGPMV